jgi:hypothetical protein
VHVGSCHVLILVAAWLKWIEMDWIPAELVKVNYLTLPYFINEKMQLILNN